MNATRHAVELESVKLQSGRDVFAIFELRTCIETEAAALPAQRAEPRDLEEIFRALQAIEARARNGEDASAEDFLFHMQIARTTRNPYLIDVLSQLDPSRSPRANLDSERYLSQVNHEHTDIYEAIARGEAEGARAAMRTHLINSRELLRRASVARRDGSLVPRYRLFVLHYVRPPKPPAKAVHPYLICPVLIHPSEMETRFRSVDRKRRALVEWMNADAPLRQFAPRGAPTLRRQAYAPVFRPRVEDYRGMRRQANPSAG